MPSRVALLLWRFNHANADAALSSSEASTGTGSAAFDARLDAAAIFFADMAMTSVDERTIEFRSPSARVAARFRPCCIDLPKIRRRSVAVRCDPFFEFAPRVRQSL